MSENLKEFLTKKIVNNIPKNKKPINYLMDILNIGRESTYRRMRGDIPFTFDEIAKLSIELNISVDEIIRKHKRFNGYTGDSKQKNQLDFDEYFFASHSNHHKMFELIGHADETEVLISLNRLFSFFLVDFNLLFKFYYYKWIHKCGNISSNRTFSEIELPANIVSIQKKINSGISSVKNITFIFDQYILVRLVRELQYYASRKLISKEELLEIKKELIDFLNHIEKHIQVGAGPSQSPHHFYLSILDIDMNSIYGVIDGSVVSQCYVCNKIPINLGNDDLSILHKNWIHSLKRSSILISQSNEIIQASFLNKQYENIDKITNDLYLYYG